MKHRMHNTSKRSRHGIPLLTEEKRLSLREFLSFRPRLEVLEDRLTPAVSFGPAMTFGIGSTPSAVAVGDFNGDGKPDMASANAGGNSVSVLLNTSFAQVTSPTFTSQTTFATGSTPSMSQLAT